LTLEHLSPVIHVVAGVVIDAHERVLIAQRPAGKHLAGRWEFPGGKLEPGEGRVAGLARELKEEIGIVIGQARPLMRLRHLYSYGEVLLDVWVVRRYAGEPQSLDNQQLRWCGLDELADADLLPADQPIIGLLRLPERLRHRSSPHYEVCDEALVAARVREELYLYGAACSSPREALLAADAGADFLAMRCDLEDDELASLCRGVPIPIYARAKQLEEAWELGATGVSEIGPRFC
jgi:mutator protein MutT